jgi:hypothetical protein
MKLGKLTMIPLFCAQVTVIVDRHTCTSSGRRKTTTPTSSWVASLALTILTKKPHMGAKELQNTLQEQHNCTISYDTVWKGKEKALRELYGTWEDSFKLLSRWREAILEVMPDSVIEFDLVVEDGRLYFSRFFCAFGPCLEGFREGCRPYLSVDSTALNGRWNGHLPSATSVDGHNWMFPVAFGFFESETKDSWIWFMQQLRKAIGDPPVLAICSDGCKGLTTAVNDVFPNAEKENAFATSCKTTLSTSLVQSTCIRQLEHIGTPFLSTTSVMPGIYQV